MEEVLGAAVMWWGASHPVLGGVEMEVKKDFLEEMLSTHKFKNQEEFNRQEDKRKNISGSGRVCANV